MTQFFNITAAARTAKPTARATVFVFTAKSGAWMVRDEGDVKGGVFATRKAANWFIKREFGETAIIINADPETAASSCAA